jgi:NADH:ubiquinone oxidoreductase subunit 6 (subunit J)
VLLVQAFRDSYVKTEELRLAGAQRMGEILFGRWVLPFELLSVLLLAALIGAIVISRPSGPADLKQPEREG